MQIPFVVGEKFNPLACFTYTPRSMVCLTQARGQTQTETKVGLMAQSLVLENSNLTNARASVRGYLADQGAAEKKGVRHVFGDPDEIAAVTKRLKSKEISLHSEECRNICFLWNALEVPGVFHIIYNPVQASFEGVDEWNSYFPQLKGICKSLGEPSYKEVHLETTFKDLPLSYLDLANGFRKASRTQCSSIQNIATISEGTFFF